MSESAFEKIHHINRRFNRVFSKPVYYFAKTVTIINFVLPYFLRIVFAFAINLFFNRPIIYLNFFAKKIGKNINFVVISFFYIVALGVYSVFYRFFLLWRSGGRERRGWSDVRSFPHNGAVEDHFYQS